MVWHRFISGIVVFAGGCIFMANFIHRYGMNENYDAQTWKMPISALVSLAIIIKMTERDKQ